MTTKLSSLLHLLIDRRQQLLAMTRAPMSKEGFVRAIAEAGGSAAAAALVRDEILKLVDPSFTPYPDDELLSVLRIAEEELEEDLITSICVQLGREVPTQALVDEFGKVDTPRRVVELIGRCPPARDPVGRGSI